MIGFSGFYLGILFRHYRSQISFRRPAVSGEFQVFARFLRGKWKGSVSCYIMCALFNSVILLIVFHKTHIHSLSNEYRKSKK
jgi:hypothetical protein